MFSTHPTRTRTELRGADPRRSSLVTRVVAVRALAAAVTLGAAAIGPGAAPASAATFTVEPTQIFLSRPSGSVLLRIRNESRETLRFQLSVFKWNQSPSGEMELERTEDIVFFPSLLVLQPSEERRVRVGSATAFDVREKTYRIFVEELPRSAAAPSAGVRVLTRMGIPIFLRPSKAIASASLANLRREGDSVRFTLANEGTVHVIPQRVTVRGLADDSPAFERRVDGWYVLAGGRRDFDLPLPATECARLTSVVVEVQFGAEMVQERLQMPGGACPD